MKRFNVVATMVAAALTLAAAAFAGDPSRKPRPTRSVCIDADPNTDTNPANSTHDIVAFVTDGTFDAGGDAADTPGSVDNDCTGTALQGRSVTFVITDDDPDAALIPDYAGGENQETVATDAGPAMLTLDNKPNVQGTNTVSADVQGTDSEKGNRIVQADWSPPPGDVTIVMAVGPGNMGKAVPLKERRFNVPEGASGVGILNRAVQEGLIHSYQTWATPRGQQVKCIDDICGEQVFVCGFLGYLGWGFYENGAVDPASLGAIRADEGDRFDVAFPRLDARLLVC